MRWLAWIGIVGLVILVGLSAWVRLAPTDTAIWHKAADPRPSGDYPAAGGFEAVRRITEPSAPAVLDEVIRATPRTQVLAGSIEAGLVTYVTRSRIFGFPDYTTVTMRGEEISIRGRLRFGGSDLGVNRARIEAWLAKVDGVSGP